jgi:predicted O-methyltransferase YrrM
MQSQRSSVKEKLRFSGYGKKSTISPDALYSPPGWYSDHPVFEQMISILKPKLILDVGSLWGASSVRMARLAREISPADEVTVVAIDTWLGSKEHHLSMAIEEYRYGAMYDRFCENIVRSGVADLVVPFPQTSVTAAQILAHYQIQPDLIYIDASHDYRSVLTDIEIYWKLLRNGGVLIGDDFEEPWYGVIRAVLEFTEKLGVPLQLSKAQASGADGVKKISCKYVLQKGHVASPKG